MFYDEEEKRSVGRPRLADSDLKKKSLILCAICMVAVTVLLLVGAFKLNIVSLKGSVADELQIGEKFCLGDECFYTLRKTNNSVIAIAEYNLLVGNVYDESREKLTEIDSENTPGYGVQNQSARGYTNDSSQYVGVLEFANGDEDTSGYWWDSRYNYFQEEFQGKAVDETLYVFSEDSELYTYITDYNRYLNKDFKGVKTRLFNYDDYKSLFCLDEDESCYKYEDADDYPWLGQTSFWTGYTVYSGIEDSVMALSRDEAFDYYDYYVPNYFGVRPVIEIPNDLIPKNKGFKYKTYEIGEEMCFDDECFNVVSQDKDTVSLLAKYNLLVGDKYELNETQDDYEKTHEYVKGDKGYGLQASNARGYLEDGEPIDGVINFAKKNDGDEHWYWVDPETGDMKHKYITEREIMEGYSEPYMYLYDPDEERFLLGPALKNYENALANKISVKARLMYYDELLNIFCPNMECEGGPVIPEWYSLSSYWTGVTFSDESVLAVIGNEYVLDEEANPENTLYGIRPVIDVRKSDLEPDEDSKEETKPSDIKTDESTAQTVKKNEEVETKIVTVHEDKKGDATNGVSSKKPNSTSSSLLSKPIVVYDSKYESWVRPLLIIDGVLFLIMLVESIIYFVSRFKNRKHNG